MELHVLVIVAEVTSEVDLVALNDRLVVPESWGNHNSTMPSWKGTISPYLRVGAKRTQAQICQCGIDNQPSDNLLCYPIFNHQNIYSISFLSYDIRFHI